ncbi:MAG TPA: hypothetical protein VE397_19600 [Stellaceae bacterium]|nr:hypothetical protein [Stellaceae bacterium]
MQKTMRTLVLLVALCLPAAAEAAPIPCSDIPAAQQYVDRLKPGPDRTEAQRHLDLAKEAHSNAACDKELRQVDKYARAARAAENRADAPKLAPATAPHVRCADLLHQDRPGGSDYHGPPVPGCPKR